MRVTIQILSLDHCVLNEAAHYFATDTEMWGRLAQIASLLCEKDVRIRALDQSGNIVASLVAPTTEEYPDLSAAPACVLKSEASQNHSNARPYSVSTPQTRFNDSSPRSNVEHFLNLLDENHLTADERSALNKLVVMEEDKLAHNSEELAFAEARLERCRRQLSRMRALRKSLPIGCASRRHAANTIMEFQITLGHIEEACRRLKERVAAQALL